MNKFRVWCKNKKEWETDKVLVDSDGNLYQIDYRDIGGYYKLQLLSNKTHIVQYRTGLKDANHNEIYEGDIIKLYSGYGGDWFYEEEILPVLWDKNGACFYVDSLKDGNFYENCIVIGNIYENQELLEENN